MFFDGTNRKMELREKRRNMVQRTGSSQISPFKSTKKKGLIWKLRKVIYFKSLRIIKVNLLCSIIMFKILMLPFWKL